MNAHATNLAPAADESWWETDGATGKVDPKLLAPDPFQPRKFIVESDLAELAESIRHSGVRERLIISPLSNMPWIRLGPEYAACKFLISSGHRRQLASLRAKVDEVPVEIKIYPDEKAHREDAALRNAQRVNLSPLEEAFEIERRKNLDEPLEHIAASFGKTTTWAIKLRLPLVRLDPLIQARLDPNVPREVILATSIASELGGVGTPTREKLGELIDEYDLQVLVPDESADEDTIRFAYQRALLATIDEKHMNAIAAREFIVGSKHTHGAMQRNIDRRPPSKGSKMLKSLFDHIEGHVVSGWGAPEYSHALRMLDIPHAEELVKAGSKALKSFQSVMLLMEQALEHKRVATHNTTPQMMQPTAKPSAMIDLHAARSTMPRQPAAAPPPKPEVRPTPTPVRAEPAQQPAARRDPPPAPRPQVAKQATAATQSPVRTFERDEPLRTRPIVRDPSHISQPRPTPVPIARSKSVFAEPPPPPPNLFKPVHANFWSVKVGRFVGEQITNAEMYIELWEHKSFKWQREGLEKPDHLPNIKEVRALLSKA